MSVRTTADEKLEEARVAIQVAAEVLSRVVVEKCWGHDEFNGDFRKKIKETFYKLVEIVL